MAEPFDPYSKWLGIKSPRRPPDHYQLLGVDRFIDDTTILHEAADRQMAVLRKLQLSAHGKLSQKLLNEVAAARICLLDREKKAAYDAWLKEQLLPPRPVARDTKATSSEPASVPPRPAVAAIPTPASSEQPDSAATARGQSVPEAASPDRSPVNWLLVSILVGVGGVLIVVSAALWLPADDDSTTGKVTQTAGQPHRVGREAGSDKEELKPSQIPRRTPARPTTPGGIDDDHEPPNLQPPDDREDAGARDDVAVTNGSDDPLETTPPSPLGKYPVPFDGDPQREGYEQLQVALAMLKAEPDDAAANFVAGRHLCFVQHDWDEGLKLLAKCDNAAIQSLAVMEMSYADGETAKTDATVSLANAWWDLASQANGMEKDGARHRAKYWYTKAAAALPRNLMRVMVEKRLAALADVSEP